MVEFLEVVARLERLNKSVVIGRVQPGLIPRPGEERTIDVWWGGMQRNGDLMLLLAHLLTQNREWRGARIRVRSMASNDHMKAATEAHLAWLLPDLRISAESDVTLRPADSTVREIIHRESADADLVFLGLSIPESAEERESYSERLHQLGEPLRTVFFVKNSSLFHGELVQTAEQVARTAEGAAGEG